MSCMKLGVGLIFFGSLSLWQFSTVFGIILVAVGVGCIGYLAVQEEEVRAPARDYSGGDSVTYNISSKPRH